MRGIKKAARTGAATVEFAVIAPILVLVVLGMIEVGRGVSVSHSLQNAARSGCRVAIIEGATQSQISERVSDSLTGTGISDYSVTVEPSPLSAAALGDPVTVTISVLYDEVSWVPVPKFLGGNTVAASCSFPKE